MIQPDVKITRSGESKILSILEVSGSVSAMKLSLPGQIANGVISEGGERLKVFLDGTHVETRWIANYHVIWQTGQRNGPAEGHPARHTHCVKAPLQIDSRCPQLEFRKSTAHSTADGFKLLDRE